MSDLFMTGASLDECWHLVRQFHYSRRMPSAVKHAFAWRRSGGLFGDHGEAEAVALYGQPVNRNWPQDAIELQRLVRRDDFGEPLSSFVSWTLRWLREHCDYPFALSYADTGEGHHGGIYQATNWTFVATKESRHVGFNTVDGRFIHGRTSNALNGTRSVQKIAEIHPTWQPVYGEPKHLYIKPLRQKLSTVLRRFEWSALPYPKPNAARPSDERSSRLCEAGESPAGRSSLGCA